MAKKKTPRYVKESDLTAEIIMDFGSIADLIGIPHVLKLEQERIIAPFQVTARSRKLPRADLVATHMDSEFTIIEVKIMKSIHDMTQGIAQLLTYQHYAEPAWKTNRLNLVLISNEITTAAVAVVQRYELPIILVEYGDSTIVSGRLRKHERY